MLLSRRFVAHSCRRTAALHARFALGAAAVAPTAAVTASTALCARRTFMPLPSDQTQFSQYTEIDLPSEGRIESIRAAGIASKNDVWVALEKVHGTNLGVYLINESEMRYAKRSGLMDPNENFFGYHILSDQFEAHTRAIHQMLREKLNVSSIAKVIMHGELFGAKYKHPQVKKSDKWVTLPNGKKFPLAGVLIQREPFPQYSPDLHFFCFDIKYSISGREDDEVVLCYSDFEAICSKIPGLLYARPIVRGTLDQCLAFDVENFITPLPALLGLGNYPLEGNFAEGIVVKHIGRGTPQIDSKNVCTMLKIRCSSFMELKHPNKQKELKETYFDTVRKAAVRRAGDTVGLSDAMMPAVEAAANDLLLNNVSEGRLSNVISKINRETLVDGTTSQEQLTLLLAKDSLKDFLKEGDDLILNTSIVFRKMLIKNVYYEAQKLVRAKWAELTEATVAPE